MALVQLHVLSGKKAGSHLACSQFPIQAGRAAESDLALDEPGVWPRHFQITRTAQGLLCEAHESALMSVNGAPVAEAVLRNGDVISIGTLKIRFALGPVRQSSLTLREWMVWTGLVVLCAGQVVVIGKLLE